MRPARAMVRWTAVLLAVSALLFASAVLLEGAGRSMAAPTQAAAPAQGHDEAAEQGEGHSETGEAAAIPQGDQDGGIESGEHHADETLFGINLENPVLVWGFVVVSLIVAAGVYQFGRPLLPVAIIAAGIAAILDVREVVSRLADANVGVATLAGLTAVAHVAVVILAVLAWRAASISPRKFAS